METALPSKERVIAEWNHSAQCYSARGNCGSEVSHTHGDYTTQLLAFVAHCFNRVVTFSEVREAVEAVEAVEVVVTLGPSNRMTSGVS